MSSSRRGKARPPARKSKAGKARASTPAAAAARKRTGPKPVSRPAAKTVAARSPANNQPATRPRPSIRLPGSGSSRLTIKAGPPGATRTHLVPSDKVRPPGPGRLSEVELDEDEVLIDGFTATLDGVIVRITAVLERTCVYLDRDGDRRLARKKDLWVEADKLPIRRPGIG